MAINIQQRKNGKCQLRVIHKLLERAFFATFDDVDSARAYGEELESKLQAGKVPPEIDRRCNGPKLEHEVTIHSLVDRYVKENLSISQTDLEMASAIKARVENVPISLVTYDFITKHAKKLRFDANLSPDRVGKHFDFLGRVWDWYYAITEQHSSLNIWRKLPPGAKVVTEEEKALLIAQGKKIKMSEERERRFEDGEEGRLDKVFAGEKPAHKQRKLEFDPELLMMYRIILNTGLRLRECYTLKKDQINLKKRLIKARGTKGSRGAAKPREVPIRRELGVWLGAWLEQMPQGQECLFPGYWNGTEDRAHLTKVSNELSVQFAKRFEHAAMENFTEHDLRHEATCRWVLLSHENGNWVFPEIMIVKIMGWSSSKMYKRYASLRGEDMVELLGAL